MKFFVLFLGLLFGSADLLAQASSHAYLNHRRSSIVSHMYFQQSLEGEFGSFSTTGKRTGESGDNKNYSDSQDWKGYGLGTHFGLEVLKFVQFTAGHTFVNIQHKDDRTERLNGSRLSAGVNLVFLAPVFNLEFGTGVIGSRYDYQKQLENATFHGSGFYQGITFNHFLNSKVSLFANGVLSREHLARTGGASAVRDMDTDTTRMGVGFRIWL